MTPAANRLSLRDAGYILLAIVIWGFGFVPTKLALVDFTPFQLGTLRFLLAAFPLVLLLPRPRIPVKWLFLYGLSQGFGQFGLLFFALHVGMSAGLASVLMQTQVFITALLGVTWLKETLSWPLIVGMALGRRRVCAVLR